MLAAHVLGTGCAGPGPGALDGPAQGRAGRRGDRRGALGAGGRGSALGVVVAGPAAINTAVVLLPAVDAQPVRPLGIDEHRYRSVRWFRDQDGAWRRFEPWMTTFVNLDTGTVLGVVDGRDSAHVGDWLQAREASWREGVEVVAIDPSAAFRKAITTHLPTAAVSVDAFHLVQLANHAVTAVRQRRAREVTTVADAPATRRGRTGACCRALPTPSRRAGGPASSTSSPSTTRPTGQLEWAWAVKEHVRMLLGGHQPRRCRARHADPARGRRRGEHARDRPGHRDPESLVARHRGPDRHRRDERAHRGREHHDQEHQAHRPRLPQRELLPRPYPAHHAGKTAA